VLAAGRAAKPSPRAFTEFLGADVSRSVDRYKRILSVLITAI
jgi:hypothetical protein